MFPVMLIFPERLSPISESVFTCFVARFYSEELC